MSPIGRALVVLLLVASGCQPAPAHQAIATPRPTPSPARGPALDDATNQSCDRTTRDRALAPAVPPPAPGAMPAGSFMASIQQRRWLIAGVTRGTFGFGYLDPTTHQPTGWDVDMARQLSLAIFGDADRVQYRFLTTAERIPELTKGDVDVVISTMTITCGRWRQVAFSSPYYSDWQTVLVPMSSTATSLHEMNGARVCATIGSTSIYYLEQQHPDKFPTGMKPIAVPDFNDCLVLLQQGQVDAIATNEGILHALMQEDPYTKIIAPRMVLEAHGFAISQCHPDFVRFANAVLDRMRTDETWATLYGRWLESWLGPASPPAADYGDHSPNGLTCAA